MLPSKRDPAVDRNDPRGGHAVQQGLQRRSYSAHLNAFEAFPFFAAAVILAELKGAAPLVVDTAALVFIVARFAHALFYLAGIGPLRSLAFAIGFAATVVIFLSPLFA